MEFRFQKFWQLIGISLVAFIITVSLMHKPPIDLPPFRFADKMGHFMAYFIVMGWYVQMFHAPVQRLFLMAVFVVMGVGLEVLQGLGGVRVFEWADALANSLGALAAFALGKTGFQYYLSRVEKHFFP
ncbi:hypothetical protein MNBD_GAMMA12-910 [hydrothermal vent metagenome]|uniref:VanZ-like domain-containing protein n=1 Tax=hydrothermal vent metagenome TaxID=652676 RepID=A0A3B0Z445_9ZZZZ